MDGGQVALRADGSSLFCRTGGDGMVCYRVAAARMRHASAFPAGGVGFGGDARPLF